ncbi:hypothetical protein CSA37_10585 [Candidatus Fermentibacteria bacterium]|nr:MAG: hypothetical protein CSA37_10585 [Candidatus Fermentibacteria bacterium]
MADRLYMIFKTMTHVLMAQRAAREAGVQCRMVPIPRKLSTDCGMCIILNAEHSAAFLEALGKKGLKPDRVEESVGPVSGSRCYSR